MVNYLTQSEHRIGGYEMEKEKAWHILSILFSIGTPLRAADLAYRCRLFDVSVEFIEFLCSIPDSPLYLTEDRYVSISSVAFSVITEFVGKAVSKFVPRISIRVSEPKGLWNGVIRTYNLKRKDDGEASFVLPSAKRRLILGPEDEGNRCVLALENNVQTPAKAQVGIIKNTNLLLEGGMSIIDHEPKVSSPEVSIEIPDTYGTSPMDCVKDGNQGKEKVVVPKKLQDSVDIQQYQCSYLSTEIDSNFLKADDSESGYEQTFLTKIVDISGVQNNDDKICVAKRGSTTTCQETENWVEGLPVESVIYDDFVSKTIENVIAEAKVQYRCEGGEDKINPSPAKGSLKLLVQTDTVQGSLENDLRSINETCYDDQAKPSNKEKLNSKMEIQGHFPSVQPNKAKTPSAKASLKVKSTQNLLTVGPKVTTKVFDCNVANDSKQEKCKRDQKSILVQEKLKNDFKTANKESKANATSTDPKNNFEAKALPDFESFIVEEEEGSGGYGTVYRARRKTDGKTFAIKCPHANAHIHHVNNELKMLEQFGGQNFVIKFEGSFKSSDAECFVLEHVEHDRPEVLKREIDVFQLQWYGYCMFRALASLHKQGIVHRDVKPGNFLFSRKLNKGYLIDFNLAMDLHKKYGTTSKLKTYSMSLNRVPLPCSVSIPPIKGRKTTGGTVLEPGNREMKKDTKLPHEPKNAKKRADVIHSKPYTDLGTRSILKSQGADGSGITSTKEGTSGRTPSAERLREPRPYSSRKELNRLVQEAMGNTDHKAVRSLPTQRKRVAAPPGKMDRKFYLTPMPVNSNGSAVSGSGLWKNKGDGKHKREGPCVGTKGFRAPEVLFKSPHQGCKVDVWSAGVTLLYLMIGRTPFTGDPEQNVKDIAKLRGSEDLWEVAKLHNRETSFPMELFDIQSLPYMSIRDWCEMNTKRPEFLDMMPNSLFDLIEKCLTVNPRCRISADEALGHEFFTRCHEDLRRKRLMRKTLSLDSGTSLLAEGQSKAEVKV